MITQTYLKEIFDYNPDTGVFTRLISTTNCVKVGDIAGCVNKNHGYRAISVKNKLYLAHRLAWLYMTGEWPKDQIDHINHDRVDNRWVNLRKATRQENGKNMSMSKRNTSGVTGVCWAKVESKWFAQIMVDSKTIGLSYFADKFEAICARKSAENKYGFHGNHGGA